MLLRTSLTNRRRFLERSMLGFGSAFLLPSLLTSCSDHIIPDPNPDPNLPETDPGIDWNDDARSAVIFGVGFIPEAGDVLSKLLEVLWPESQSPFDKMKSQVEALIDQQLNQDKYNTVKGILGSAGSQSGLVELIADYTSYISALAKDPTNVVSKSTVVDQYNRTKDFFIANLQAFQSSGYEVLLLPLFAQYANMFLALLRDGALHGKDWDMDPTLINEANTKLDFYIPQFTNYVATTYTRGYAQAYAFANDQNKHPDDWQQKHDLEPFKSTNAYARQTTLTVLDFSNTWQYYSVSKYPNGKTGADGGPIKVTELLPREIYSDPYGTTIRDDGGVHNIPLPSPSGGGPSSLPTQIGVWAGQRIDAIQLSYPQGGGPNGITQTARMGGPGGDLGPNGGIIINSLSNPIKQFRVGSLNYKYSPYTPILSYLQFAYGDNFATKLYGGGDTIPKDDSGWVSYPGEAVSSIHIDGSVNVQGHSVTNCIVVGFKYWDSPTLALRAVRIHYVTSPTEKTLADLVKAFPGVVIPAGLIAEAKAERQAFWARVEAIAKAPK